MKKYSRRMRPLLGTFVEIGTYQSTHNHETIVTEAFDIIQKVHSLLSFHDPNSELSKLNSSSGCKLRLSPLTILALRLAKRMTYLSMGHFNCTVGGKMISRGSLPRHNKIVSLDCGDSQDLMIRGFTAQLLRPVHITLDGIAKGLAVDLAVKKMRKSGLRNGWVNAGGDLKVFGNIDLPVLRRELQDQKVPLGRFRNTSLATSYLGENPDPRYPGYIVGSSDKGFVTVQAPSAWLADALTKVAACNSALVSSLGGKLL